jgi:hypothetical protein
LNERQRRQHYLNTPQERIKIHFVHCTIVEISTDAISPVLLVVCEEMFGASLNANALNTDYSFVCAFAVEVWIRAETMVAIVGSVRRTL